jgi:pyruvate/2-oxoglutarate dehydrogenase complex dihydrolipoamide dehydrogenase (E3) component
MARETFDAIVVGAGQAGPALAARCDKEGLRVALIERGPLGGTCVNVGCIPTKTMVASARAMHQARRGAEFGFSVEQMRVDMRRVKARKDEIVRASREGVGKWIASLDRVELIRGEARFVAPRVLAVGARELAAERVFLDVGGRPTVPDLPGVHEVPFLDSTSVMELEQVPEHLVIVGGSYIGLEFAQMMRRFGARVSVLERMAKLLPREDDDVAAGIRAILEAEGIELRTGMECLSLERRGERIVVGGACNGGADAVEGSHVLLAVGRTPNTEGLGLDVAGIETDARGYIRVDERLQTSAEGVWALGDCNGRGAFTHTAWNDHEIVAANLFDGAERKVGERIACYALFIDPALGRAGLSEGEVRASGRKALVATMPMQRVGRAREAGETGGFMTALVDAERDRLLGATILGLNGDEVVHALLDMMAADRPASLLARTMHIHPTVSELLPTLLQQLKPLT